MKNIVLIFTMLCVLFNFNTNAIAFTNHTNHITNGNALPDGYERIELHGSFDYSVGPNGIEAGASQSHVLVEFNQNYGNITMLLYNGSGIIIYYGVVNTAVQQQAMIPLDGGSSGTYILELSNNNGIAQGEFDR